MAPDHEMIADFGELMERSPPLPTRIEDVSALPSEGSNIDRLGPRPSIEPL